jgi:4,5-dihydroxyphthalate decarboxylase
VKEVDVELPPSIRRQLVPGDRTLGAMVEAGELDAFVGARVPADFRAPSSRIRRLFPNYREVERAYYRKTGIFPIMHVVVLKEELAHQHPWLPGSLYEAFRAAKRIAYERLDETAALAYALPWLVAEAEETRALMGDDPFAYGIGATRTTLETFLGYSFRQGLARRRLAIEEMFCASTLDT